MIKGCLIIMKSTLKFDFLAFIAAALIKFFFSV